MKSSALSAVGRMVNLVVPGGGLILIGYEALGMLVAVLFSASTCYVIAAGLLFPDDTTIAWRNLILGIALGTWVGAQIRYAQSVRHLREEAADARRRKSLRETQAALREDRVGDAWRAIKPLAELAESDLALAYRLAQVQSARGEYARARQAWRRVRRLDRHRIYRAETLAAERALDESDHASVRPHAADSLDA